MLLSDFTHEIGKAIFDSEILRNHLTIEIRTPDGYKQEYRVLYRNKNRKNKNLEKEEANNLKCIRLAARRKTVQRNLSVHDREGNRLALIPSDLVHNALCNICKYYLDEARRRAGNAYTKLFDKLIQDMDFSKVFAYESDPEEVQGNIDTLMSFLSMLKSRPPKSLDSILFYMRRIYYLIRTYKHFYIPIVKLEKALVPRDCILINYHIENLVKGQEQMRGWKLYTFGVLDISLPLELEPTASNHIRILTPPGMVFCKAGIPKVPAYASLDRFMDDDMVYFHIPKEKANEIMQKQTKKIEREEGYITLDVTIGISSSFSRPSLIRALSSLTYISVFLPLIAFFSPWNAFIFGYSIISNSVLMIFTILISLAVYSMNKRFLHDYLVGQIMILSTFFIFELILICSLIS